MVHGMTKCENMVEGKFDPKYLLGINNTYINISLVDLLEYFVLENFPMVYILTQCSLPYLGQIQKKSSHFEQFPWSFTSLSVS